MLLGHSVSSQVFQAHMALPPGKDAWLEGAVNATLEPPESDSSFSSTSCCTLTVQTRLMHHLLHTWDDMSLS